MDFSRRGRSGPRGGHVAVGMMAVIFSCVTARSAAAQGAVVVRPVAPGERIIFVPKPRGAGETLDNAPREAGAGTADSVLLATGDRLHGKVLGIDAEGRLRLTAAHFDGEVRVLVPRLDRVILSGEKQDSGADTVNLTNGDRITGTISAMTSDAVVIESPAAGLLKVARKMVRSIAFGQGSGMLVESDFGMDRMDPWSQVTGQWRVENGVLICYSGGQSSSLAAPSAQKEAVTFVADVKSRSGRNINCEMILFASDKKHYYGRDSVFLQLSSHDYRIQYCQNGRTRHLRNGRYSQQGAAEGVFRFAYDPASGKTYFWYNQQSLGEWEMPFTPKEGKYVLFGCRQSLAIRSLRVLEGIVPPGDSGNKGEAEEDQVVFRNKDRVSVSGLTLGDGVCRAKTSFGDVRTPLDRIRRISLATKQQERPRRRKGDVRVTTHDSRFTLQFARLTDEFLEGGSDATGTIKVRRRAIRRIAFNIYPKE